MLVSLAIRDIVLIDRLDLEFRDGLGVLTGETGAGKSILLDALGLALGERADSALLRQGAEQAVVTAAFDLPPGHRARTILAEQALAPTDDVLIVRRILGRDGRGRAFVNDQPVSVSLLRQLGDELVEVQGQFEQRGLLDSTTHRRLLDAYGNHADLLGDCAARWRTWEDAREAHAEAEAEIARARQDEAYLRHAVEELDLLDPQVGEEERLDEERAMLMNAGKLVDAMNLAHAELSGSDRGKGAEAALGAARGALEKVAQHAGRHLDAVLAALDRAAAETEEAVAQLQSASTELDLDPARQETVEERYFALKDMARKHLCEPDDLPALRGELSQRLAAIDSGGEHLAELKRQEQQARNAYLRTAEALSAARTRAAERLDAAVDAELPPLKLDKARFRTRLVELDEADWGAKGRERVVFEVATNPGTAPGPLTKIASGGELSRFLLALKVVLAELGSTSTLIFDEVDSGIGGATAHAVGERLGRLAEGRQVLVVTHSPQVAARGRHHWRVVKEHAGDSMVTRVSPLDAEQRREEIARMLSGASITEEARAAAEKLMGAA
jgi:DNA repair protein RecN (Recombination protein N)